MKIGFFSLVFFTAFVSFGNNEKQISRKEYVEIWRNTAVQQMIEYKIPASITLSQAILESGSGNSVLAQKGNNHFGIKCHDWKGETMFLDDDKEDECFRVYSDANESYLDHSKFLKDKKRYAALFSLEISDYEGWAKGLKDAGYATSSKYPELLIGIIKDLKLDELDQFGIQNNEVAPQLALNKSMSSASFSAHTVSIHTNKVKYVIAKKGDTYYRISQEFGLALWQLYKYNDFDSKKDCLVEGDIIYIQPKRNKSKNKFVILSKNMTANELSQIEAISPEKLVKRNGLNSPTDVLKKGEKVFLR